MLGELFDPRADLKISEHFRPHWSQAGAIVFITFRTHDSIPQQVLRRREREKQDWMERRGHSPANVGPTTATKEKTLGRADTFRYPMITFFRHSKENHGSQTLLRYTDGTFHSISRQ
jgi:hypothetical protein